ncbi:MAG TPA: 2-dehydropantoate 2-reductase [Candidatus Coproplasma excrementipullorum]|nr:2-dehydropantoate 2-reductase [Candidatus Coproplasma excrementipullorum]
MRACIYGAGAMGTVLGAFIARAGRQIDLVTRNREHVAALKAGGAKITFASGGGFTQQVSAFLPEEMSGGYDVIFLMTKQRDNARIVAGLLPFLNDGGAICTTQNGLPEPSVAEVAGEENTLGCAVSWGATYVGPGHAILTSSPDAMTFSLGSPFGQNAKTALVSPYLECAGRVEEESNFAGARWSKLIVNSAFSSLSAITSLTFGRIAGGLKSRALAQILLKEGIDAALANGVTLQKIQGHDLVKWLDYRGLFKRSLSYLIIPIAMKKHENLVSGMYYDLASGKKCDIDFISGVISRYAHKAGVSVPATDAVLAVASRIERGEITVCPDNMAEVTAMLKK